MAHGEAVSRSFGNTARVDHSEVFDEFPRVLAIRRAEWGGYCYRVIAPGRPLGERIIISGHTYRLNDVIERLWISAHEPEP